MVKGTRYLFGTHDIKVVRLNCQKPSPTTGAICGGETFWQVGAGEPPHRCGKCGSVWYVGTTLSLFLDSLKDLNDMNETPPVAVVLEFADGE